MIESDSAAGLSLRRRCRGWRPLLRAFISCGLACALLATACGSSSGDTRDRADDGAAPAATGLAASEPADRDPPPVVLDPTSTWQWQLQGTLNTTYDVDIYDIDLFDTDAAVIEQLHGEGRLVICYFSAGSFESWRGDANAFGSDAIGAPLDGWEEERWLDTRSSSVRAAMAGRLELANDKGCDGVEPDNVTALNNDTGFPIGADDQLDFNRFLAEAAHERGLLIGLKNDLDQIPELVEWFDFAVNEECIEFDECDAYQPFFAAGKPVFNAEYAAGFVDDAANACRLAADYGLRTLILPLDLDDSFRIACD